MDYIRNDYETILARKDAKEEKSRRGIDRNGYRRKKRS